MLRTVLLRLAESERLKMWFSRSRFGKRLASRFVAGERCDEALTVVERLNAQGMSATLDFLGERTRGADQARTARNEFLFLLDIARSHKLNTNISVKLTHLGLDIDERLCEELLSSLVERAAAFGNFVRVDMEGSAYTERTLAMVKRLHARYPCHIGPVVQAYLYRSEQDVQELLKLGCRLRLCKGAYRELPTIAFYQKRDVDRNFEKLMRYLIGSAAYHGIATHDPAMIVETMRYAGRHRVSKNTFEFQMLYGIRQDLAKRLVAMSYRVRIYVPYGREWFPYFMRRLAERPANLFFFLKNMLR